MNDPKTERINNKNSYTNKLFFIGLGFTVIIVISTLLSIFGGVICYDTTLNPLSALNKIIQIININKYNVYNIIINLLLAIMYIIYIVGLIKVSIFTINNLLKIKKSKKEEQNTIIDNIYKRITKSFSFGVSLIIVSYLIGEWEINVQCIILIIMISLFYILKEATILIISEKENLKTKDIVIDIIGKTIIVAWIIILSIQIVKPSIDAATTNFPLFIQLFKYQGKGVRIGLYLMYHYEIGHILSISLIFMYISLIQRLLETVNGKYTKIRKLVFSMIIFTFIYMFIDNFVEGQVLAGNVYLTGDILLNWLKASLSNFISIIIALVAGLIILCTPMYYRLNSVLRSDEN